MLAHDLRYRTGSVPWGLVTVLAALMLLLLGLGRITMDARGFQQSAESQLRSRFQLMQQMAPPGSRVLAWQSDPVTRDVVVVLLRLTFLLLADQSRHRASRPLSPTTL